MSLSASQDEIYVDDTYEKELNSILNEASDDLMNTCSTIETEHLAL